MLLVERGMEGFEGGEAGTGRGLAFEVEGANEPIDDARDGRFENEGSFSRAGTRGRPCSRRARRVVRGFEAMVGNDCERGRDGDDDVETPCDRSEGVIDERVEGSDGEAGAVAKRRESSICSSKCSSRSTSASISTDKL